MKKTPGMILLPLLFAGLLIASCRQPNDVVLDPPPETLETQIFITDQGLPGIEAKAIEAKNLDRTVYGAAAIIDESDGSVDITTAGAIDLTKIDDAIYYMNNILYEISDNQYAGTFNFDIYSANEAILTIKLAIEEGSITLTTAEKDALDAKVAALQAKVDEYNGESVTVKNANIDQADVTSKVVEDNDPGDGRTLLEVTASTDWSTLFSQLDSFDDTANFGVEITIPASWTQVSLDYFDAGFGYPSHDLPSEYLLDVLKGNLETLQTKLDAIDAADTTVAKAFTSGRSDIYIDYDASTIVDADQANVDSTKSGIATLQTAISAIFSGKTSSVDFEDVNTVSFDIDVVAVQNIDLTGTNAGSNGDGYLTAAEIASAEAQDGVNLDTLEFSGLTGLSGTFTVAELEKAKKYCITQGSYSTLPTSNCTIDLAGSAYETLINQTQMDNFFANVIGYGEIGNFKIANATWNGDFKVSPSTATGSSTATDLAGKVEFDSSISVTSLTLGLANATANPGDYFGVEASSYGELKAILDNIAASGCDASDITIDMPGIAVNIANTTENWVNSDGSANGFQVNELNLASTQVNVYIAGSNSKIDSSVYNGYNTLVDSSASHSFVGDISNVAFVGTTALEMDADGKILENVVIDCPVSGTSSFDGTISGFLVLQDVGSIDLSGIYGNSSAVLLANGNVTGLNLSDADISGYVDLQGASSNTITTGGTTYIANVRTGSRGITDAASLFTITTGIGSVTSGTGYEDSDIPSNLDTRAELESYISSAYSGISIAHLDLPTFKAGSDILAPQMFGVPVSDEEYQRLVMINNGNERTV